MEELSSQFSGFNGSGTDLVNGKAKDEELEENIKMDMDQGKKDFKLIFT